MLNIANAGTKKLIVFYGFQLGFYADSLNDSISSLVFAGKYMYSIEALHGTLKIPNFQPIFDRIKFKREIN